jgi:hypothetical protein
MSRIIQPVESNEVGRDALIEVIQVRFDNEIIQSNVYSINNENLEDAQSLGRDQYGIVGIKRHDDSGLIFAVKVMV